MLEISKDELMNESSQFIENVFTLEPWNSVSKECTSILIYPKTQESYPFEIWIIFSNASLMSFKNFPLRDSILEYGNLISDKSSSSFKINIFSYERLKGFLQNSNSASMELNWSIRNSISLIDNHNRHFELVEESKRINLKNHENLIRNYFLSVNSIVYSINNNNKCNDLMYNELILIFMRIGNLLEKDCFPPVAVLENEFRSLEIGKKYLANLNYIKDKVYSGQELTPDSKDIINRFMSDISKLVIAKFGNTKKWMNDPNSLNYILPNFK
ncbi:MAG: hypothetical protein QMB22_03625 [Dehalococcoidia bacterium]|jgi:hypothetical protein|tara:strand:+ start:4729 stop:5541 length:813 start_codon:yes stop_codon:yes gene_type:complete